MTDILDVTLDQEKELLVTAFENDNPDLYKQYRDILNSNIFEQNVELTISISGDGTYGKSQ
jgi:hypothetical protein